MVFHLTPFTADNFHSMVQRSDRIVYVRVNDQIGIGDGLHSEIVSKLRLSAQRKSVGWGNYKLFTHDSGLIQVTADWNIILYGTSDSLGFMDQNNRPLLYPDYPRGSHVKKEREMPGYRKALTEIEAQKHLLRRETAEIAFPILVQLAPEGVRPKLFYTLGELFSSTMLDYSI